MRSVFFLIARDKTYLEKGYTSIIYTSKTKLKEYLSERWLTTSWQGCTATGKYEAYKVQTSELYVYKKGMITILDTAFWAASWWRKTSFQIGLKIREIFVIQNLLEFIPAVARKQSLKHNFCQSWRLCRTYVHFGRRFVLYIHSILDYDGRYNMLSAVFLQYRMALGPCDQCMYLSV